jgi:hypothetical protein
MYSAAIEAFHAPPDADKPPASMLGRRDGMNILDKYSLPFTTESPVF